MEGGLPLPRPNSPSPAKEEGALLPQTLACEWDFTRIQWWLGTGRVGPGTETWCLPRVMHHATSLWSHWPTWLSYLSPHSKVQEVEPVVLSQHWSLHPGDDFTCYPGILYTYPHPSLVLNQMWACRILESTP